MSMGTTNRSRTRSECALQLLSELDRIFQVNNIPYIVGGIPARAVIENKKRVFPCLDVYIDRKDYQKLYKRMLKENNDNRAVEEIQSDDLFFIKYVDRTMTFIDSYNISHGRCQGIHVKIFLVTRYRTGLFSRSYQSFDANMVKKDFSYGYLSNTRKVLFENCNFSMPQDADGWFKWLFSAGTQNEKFPGYPNATCIVSTTVGYESIMPGVEDWNQYVRLTEENLAVIDDTSRRIRRREQDINRVYENLKALYREEEQL